MYLFVKKILILVTSLSIFTIALVLMNRRYRSSNIVSKPNWKDENKGVDGSKISSGVSVFDLNRPTLEQDTYSIQCRKSKQIYVQTTLCIHDIENDIFVSKDIWNNGVWEPFTVESFNKILNDNPDYLVFDVGAQIGQYSLYAAKMGHNVITVEPFYDNILRIHKAAELESLQNKITLITNAISNKANEFKMLYRNQKNIGGQGIIKNQKIDLDEAKARNDKYLVKTIIFDDLVDHIPNNLAGNKAIMKLDIEGYEPFAFEGAERLFKTLDFQVIYMEWGNLPPQHDIEGKILNMINFLYKHNLEPYGDNQKVLDRNDWKKWPWDIIWRKNQPKV